MPQPPQQQIMDKEALVTALIQANICLRDDFHGCTPEQIVSFEKSMNIMGGLHHQLPLQYKEFLLAVGNGTNHTFLRNTVFWMSKLEQMKEVAVSLTVGDIDLPNDAFVFSMIDQGYAFLFFKLSEGDDPPVYSYYEGQGPPVVVRKSFSEYLNKLIAEEIARRRLHY